MKQGKCIKRNPIEYQYLTFESDKDYTGFESYCACEVPNIFHLRQGHIDKAKVPNAKGKYCEHEDDGYCLKKSRCPGKQKIGYFICPNDTRVYPLIGEILILRNGSPVRYIDIDKFDEVFVEKTDE